MSVPARPLTLFGRGGHKPCAHLSHLSLLAARAQCALTDLDLSQASSDKGAARLSRALHQNRSLTSLTLGMNHISTTAGIAFAEALRSNATLTSASLAGNLLGDAAFVAIAAAIAGNRTMTHLDLSRNSIRTIGAQAIRQALHTNHSLTSLGHLDGLPVAVGLRSSIEWYLRSNKERRDAVSLEAERASTQREGMLQMLPPEERKLRKQIFSLEEESSRLANDNKAHAIENTQVNRLLQETVKRNAELVDAVATLQGQVDTLRRDAAGKKVVKGRAAMRKAAKTGAKKSARQVEQQDGLTGF